MLCRWRFSIFDLAKVGQRKHPPYTYIFILRFLLFVLTRILYDCCNNFPARLSLGSLPSSALLFLKTPFFPNNIVMNRSILEITSLLRRLIPFLCRETISHFYVGLRPPSTSAGVASPPTSRATDFLAEEVTSVPWLLTTMLLPPPLGGLDLPWSADVARLSRSRKEARKGKEEEGVLAAGGDDACESSANTRGDVPAVEQQQQQHPAISSRTSASASTSALSSSGGAAMTPQPSISSDDIPEDLERVTPAALRFVCHVEVARLLAATAMGVLRDGGEEGVEEACTRLLRAGEEFFAAFGRTYGG